MLTETKKCTHFHSTISPRSNISFAIKYSNFSHLYLKWLERWWIQNIQKKKNWDQNDNSVNGGKLQTIFKNCVECARVCRQTRFDKLMLTFFSPFEWVCVMSFSIQLNSPEIKVRPYRITITFKLVFSDGIHTTIYL